MDTLGSYIGMGYSVSATRSELKQFDWRGTGLIPIYFLQSLISEIQSRLNRGRLEQGVQTLLSNRDRIDQIISSLDSPILNSFGVPIPMNTIRRKTCSRSFLLNCFRNSIPVRAIIEGKCEEYIIGSGFIFTCSGKPLVMSCVRLEDLRKISVCINDNYIAISNANIENCTKIFVDVEVAGDDYSCIKPIYTKYLPATLRSTTSTAEMIFCHLDNFFEAIGLNSVPINDRLACINRVQERLRNRGVTKEELYRYVTSGNS